MEWIDRTARMPDDSRPVLVMMDCGPVGNPDHPGYETGGKWVEISRRSAAPGGKVMLDVFTAEFAQTGQVTHWMDLPPLITGVAAPAWNVPMVDVRPSYNPELEALRRFHDFFVRRCEGLYFAHGWPAIEIFNEAAAARRGETVKPNVY